MKMFNKNSKDNKDGKKLTTGNKILISAGIVLSLGFIFIMAINIHFANVDEKFAKKFSKDEMRFDLQLTEKEYSFLDMKKTKFIFDNKTGNIDGDFLSNGKVIQGNKQNIKYSKYVITKDNQYVSTEIDGVEGWLKCDIPVKSDYKEYIKSFLKANALDCIKVYPFNDGNFVLINNGADEYMLDLNGKNITWTRGNKYEVPFVNIYTDNLECYGDSKENRYKFSKYGKLISQEKNTDN